jgi:hypothetical protein
MHRLNLDKNPTQAAEFAVDEQPLSADNQLSSQPLVRRVQLDHTDAMPKKFNSLLIFGFIAVVAGIGTGFGSYKLSASQGSPSSQEVTAQPVAGAIKKGDIFGSSNTDTFKDSAMGYLEAGGIDGEGSHRLLRPGGISQTVYLTSSVTDLDKLVGMDVKIWGETFKGQKAGWLMDVGRIEVVDPKGTAPVEK